MPFGFHPRSIDPELLGLDLTDTDSLLPNLPPPSTERKMPNRDRYGSALDRLSAATAEQPQYREPSKWQKLAGVLVGAGAGFLNTSGKPGVRVDPEVTQRGIENVTGLTGYKMRQADYRNRLSALQGQADIEKERYGAERQGVMDENTMELQRQQKAAYEAAQRRSEALARSTLNTPRKFTETEEAEHYVFPGTGAMLRVDKPPKAPSGGYQVSPEVGQRLGIVPDARGRYFAPGGAVTPPAPRTPTAPSQSQRLAEINQKLADPKLSPEQRQALEAEKKLHIDTAAQLRPPQEPRGVQGGTANDPKDIAKAIIEGRQPPVLTGLYRYGAPVRAELARSGYDHSTALRDWEAVKRHLSTLNGPQQERLRQAVTFTYDSLDVIEDLYGQWKQVGKPTDFKILNKAKLAVAKNLPGEAGAIAQGLEAQINDLVSELATVYKGGNSSTDESLKLAAQNLKSDWNEAQFTKQLELIRKNLQIRRNSIYTSEAVGVSPTSPYLPKESGAVGSGKRTLPPEAVARLKEGTETKFGNGQVWTLRNGQPFQVR